MLRHKLIHSLVLSLFFLIAGSASAQVYTVAGQIRDHQGNVIPGATVIVLSGNLTTVNTATQPGSPLATIYSDPAGTMVINQTSNPVTTNGLGQFVAYAAPGSYVIQAYRNGFQLVSPISITTNGSGAPGGMLGDIQTNGSGGNFGSENIISVDGGAYAKTGAGINLAAVAASGGTVNISYPGSYSDTVIAPPNGTTLNFTTPGTYIVAGINLPDSLTDFVQSSIYCVNGVTIQLANGANRDLITDPLFSTLTGGTNFYGAGRVRIDGCILDGNKANNSSGWVYRAYARGINLSNNKFQNGASGGRWLEWGGAESDTAPNTSIESIVYNNETMYNTGIGTVHKGPSDLMFIGERDHNQTGVGYEEFISAHVHGYNIYEDGGGACILEPGSGGISGSDLVCTTAGGIGFYDNAGGLLDLSAVTFAGGEPFVINGSGGGTVQGFIGNASGSSDCITLVTGGNVSFIGTLYNCPNALVDYTGEGSAMNIEANVIGSFAHLFHMSTSPGQGDYVNIKASGGLGWFQVPILGTADGPNTNVAQMRGMHSDTLYSTYGGYSPNQFTIENNGASDDTAATASGIYVSSYGIKRAGVAYTCTSSNGTASYFELCANFANYHASGIQLTSNDTNASDLVVNVPAVDANQSIAIYDPIGMAAKAQILHNGTIIGTQFEQYVIANGCATWASNILTSTGTPCGTSSSGVSSLNSLTGALNITAGSGISVTPSGSSIQITNTGGGTAASVTVGTTTVLSGTTAYLLYNNGGVLGNEAVSSLAIGYTQLPALSANQVLGALTATTPSGLSVPSCSGATNALIWTSGTGFGCNTITGGSGTVTSVAQTVPGGFSISGSPITASGTLAIGASVSGADYLLTSTALNTSAWEQINGGSNCGDGTHAINYSTSTHTFGCQALTTGGGGTVTSIATTSPITGGTITTTGTIACATCVVASSPGAGIAHFAGSTQTVTSSAVNLASADVTGQLPIGSVGSAGLSGTAPISIASTGAISCSTCLTSSGISGMTTGQVAIAGSATTITSSKALAGSGSGITTGPASGVTSTDLAAFTGTGGQIADSGIPDTAAGFNAVIQGLTGCNTATYVYTPQGSDCVAPGAGPGTGTQYGVTYWATSSTLGSTTPPTVNGSYSCGYTISGSAASAPLCSFPGIPVDATNPATLLYTDRANYIKWSSGSTLTMPAASTNFASNLPFVIQNTSGGTLALTPTTPNNIDGGSSQAVSNVLNNYAAFVYQDAGSPINWWTIKVPTAAIFPGVTAGSCGDATHSCSITLNSNGVVTAFSNNSISGGGSSALSAITAATGTNTIASGNNSGQVWNWALTSNSVTAMTFGETTAATGTSDVLLAVKTLSGSTAQPLVVTAGGTQALAVNTTGSTQFGSGCTVASGGFECIAGSTSGTITLGVAATAGTNTWTFPAATSTVIGSTNSDTTTTHVLHASATGYVGTFSAIATGDLPTIPIAGGGTNATSAAAGTVPNATSSSASSWTATPTLGAAGTLGSLTMGNATSGLLTLEPVTGALGTVTMYVPVPQNSPGTLTQVICSGTIALPTSAVASGGKYGASSSTPSATTCTGLATTDNIQLTFNADPTSTTGYSPSANGMLTIITYPTTNTINLYLVNNTGSSITPSAATVNYRVVR